MGRFVALIVSTLFVGAGLLVLSQIGSLSHHRAAEAAPSNEIAVDANPSTPNIDANVSVPPGSVFSIAVNVTQIAQPYNAVQLELSWPAAGLQFTGGRQIAAGLPFSCQGHP